MKVILAMLLLSMTSTAALACDRAAAKRTQIGLTQLAVWKEKDDVVTVKWGPDWDHASASQRLGLITAFADSDACLNYDTRAIHFYRYKKLVGKATPGGGVRLMK